MHKDHSPCYTILCPIKQFSKIFTLYLNCSKKKSTCDVKLILAIFVHFSTVLYFLHQLLIVIIIFSVSMNLTTLGSSYKCRQSLWLISHNINPSRSIHVVACLSLLNGNFKVYCRYIPYFVDTSINILDSFKLFTIVNTVAKNVDVKYLLKIPVGLLDHIVISCIYLFHNSHIVLLDY